MILICVLIWEFIRDNPHQQFVLLWFKGDDLQTKYIHYNQIFFISERLLNMEVMETDKNNEEGWIEVWLR